MCQRWLTVPSPLGKVSSLDDGRGKASPVKGRGTALAVEGLYNTSSEFCFTKPTFSVGVKAFNCPHPSSIRLPPSPKVEGFFSLCNIQRNGVGVGFPHVPSKFAKATKKAISSVDSNLFCNLLQFRCCLFVQVYKIRQKALTLSVLINYNNHINYMFIMKRLLRS